MASDTVQRLEETFWARRSNPRSGWTRVPTGPLLVYALSHRRWRLLGAAMVWAAINPPTFVRRRRTTRG